MSFKAVLKSIVPAPAWGALKQVRNRYTRTTFPARTVEHTYGTCRLRVRIADGLGEGWYDHDWEDLPELKLLREMGRLKPGARVFDLGAHQCVVALMLGAYVGPSGSVYAVEATDWDAEIGRQNCELNNSQNVSVIHAAIAEHPGFVDFTLDGFVYNKQNKSMPVRVRALSIDSMAEQYGIPDVLFIDIEGYECHALRGAVQTLAHNPDTFVEVHTGVGLENFGGTVTEVLNTFPADQYECWWYPAKGGALRRVDETDISSLNHHFYMIALGRLHR